MLQNNCMLSYTKKSKAKQSKATQYKGKQRVHNFTSDLSKNSLTNPVYFFLTDPDYYKYMFKSFQIKYFHLSFKKN